MSYFPAGDGTDSTPCPICSGDLSTGSDGGYSDYNHVDGVVPAGHWFADIRRCHECEVEYQIARVSYSYDDVAIARGGEVLCVEAYKLPPRPRGLF
jgi:hypothetical protein